MAEFHLADVLQRFLPAYRQHYPLTHRQALVCQHVLDCRTAKLGSQQWRCDDCGYEQVQYCSCRDRHCPRCQGKQRQQWLTKQQRQVLDCRYFHLVFTLPHELNVLSRYAAKELYSALFQAMWQTLSQFASNRRKTSGQLGVTTVLHTWGQSLSQHIHLHCLVPGGVLTTDGRWLAMKGKYLYPVKALSTVFRAKMMRALRVRQLTVPAKDELMAKPWCVYCKPSLTRPDTVLNYLSRYTQKGMLHESRLTSITDEGVSFKYKDYRQPNSPKTMRLTGVEFLRRYLLHVLPKGFMRVRHYGYLANRCRRKKLATIQPQCQSQQLTESSNKLKTITECSWPCPVCEVGVLKLCGLNLPKPTNFSAVERISSG